MNALRYARGNFLECVYVLTDWKSPSKNFLFNKNDDWKIEKHLQQKLEAARLAEQYVREDFVV